jgi:hypothetical protein
MCKHPTVVKVYEVLRNVFLKCRIYSCNFFTYLPVFSSKPGVQKLCEEFLEGIVLEVTFMLGPDIGIHKLEMKHFITTFLAAFFLHGSEKR